MSEQEVSVADGPWHCLSCGESVDAGFCVCWQCGATREGEEDVGFEPAVQPVFPSECGRCGYDLANLSHFTCPECGWFDQPDTPIFPDKGRIGALLFQGIRRRLTIGSVAALVNLLLFALVVVIDLESIARGMDGKLIADLTLWVAGILFPLTIVYAFYRSVVAKKGFDVWGPVIAGIAFLMIYSYTQEYRFW